jgi:hypothetical protein
MTQSHSGIREATNCFDPEAIAALARAFEDTCAALHVAADDEAEREIVAKCVINVALTGVRDAGTLRDCILVQTRTWMARVA